MHACMLIICIAVGSAVLCMCMRTCICTCQVQQASCLFTLGSIYYDAGEVRQAVEAFERCLVLRRKTRNKIGLAEALNKLGLTYCDIGWVYAGWSWVCCVASGFVRWCGSVGIQFLKRQGAGKQASWCWQRGNWEGSHFRLGTRSHV